ncbi:Uncharacterized conserved protein YcbX, contains MOSC and Fe-S domains [Nocardioides alpinus]|uniref:MOSC domain-containing protein n=3 Tax=Nocardioides TaxID=1839 RepID=A0A4Q2SMI7_9ACTN|nr:MOSC domain-containing protein [Nocardioides zhouii]SFB47733.1 Uncharacterized conserved protein YcbX, contains MOSC and Fe-S domains [Nocardioides alpinus]
MNSQMETVGTVAQLHTAVTKGFALRETQSIQVTPSGIVGNRDFFLVDVDEHLYSVPRDPIFLGYWTSYDPLLNLFQVGRGAAIECADQVRAAGPVRRFRFDERTVDGRWVPGPWDAFISDVAGRNLRLVRCARPGGGGDIHPVTILSTASLASLGTEADGQPVDVRRFRLNLTLDVGTTPFREDTWTGRSITVGNCVLRLRGGIPRCVAVENRPHDGDRALQVQRRIREVRGATPSRWGPSVLFGAYADVVLSGRVKVGDPVQLAT